MGNFHFRPLSFSFADYILGAKRKRRKSQGQNRAKTHLTRSLKLMLEKLEDRIYLSANAVNFDLPIWEASYGETSITTHSQGDADGDSDVDGNDFLVWQRSLGQIFVAVTYTNADFTENNTINDADLAIWNQDFGTITGAERGDGDADFDGDVDGSDFLSWQRGFGKSSPDPLGILTIDDTQSHVDQIIVSSIFDTGANANVVTVNGNATTIGVDLVEAIIVRGGDGSDEIDLRLVNTARFPNLVNGSIEIRGGRGNDVFWGSPLDDKIFGGPGDDTYQFTGTDRLGTDTLFELMGEGADTLDFSGLDQSIDIDLASATLTQVVSGNRLWLASLTEVEIENVDGTEFNDTIFGNEFDNILLGYDGDDIISGLGGDDFIFGGLGDDSLDGGSDNDLVLGGNGDDTVRGGDGVDTVSGEIGDDEVVIDPAEDYLDDIVTDIDQEVILADLNGNTNRMPELQLPGMQQLDAGTPFYLQLQSTDSDVGQTRSYSALSGLKGNATVTPGGLLTWTPTYEDAGLYVEIVVEVTDNGSPMLSDQGIITLFVNRTAPEVPEALEVTNVTTTIVTLVWNSSSGADDYQIERRAPDGTWSSVGDSGGTTSFVDSNVVDGEEYEYRVAASNSAGLSEYSLSSPVTTVLIEPTSLTGEYLSGSQSIRLEWTYPGNSNTDFLIERFDDSAGGWVEIGNVDSNTFNYTDSNILNDLHYFYRVRAINNYASSDYADSFSPPPRTQSVFVHARTPQTILYDEITAGATSAQVLSGQFDWWHNDEPFALSVEQSLTTPEIIDAGAGHAAGVGSPPQIEFGFDTGTLFNGPGIDAVIYLQVDDLGADIVSISTGYDDFSLELSGSPVVYDIFGGNSFDYYSGRVISEEVIPAGYTWRDQLHFDLSAFGVPVGAAVDSVRVQLSENAHIWGMASISQPLGIDLSINGLDDADEESIGAVVPVNSNYDEGNLDAVGNPVPDYMPDVSAGHRILSETDRQLVPATLTLFSHPYSTVVGLLGRTEGKIRLTFDETKIKVWTVDDITSELREVTSGADDKFRRFTETKIEFWIEGMNESVNPLDVEIRASFTPTFETTYILEDVINLTVVDVNLDIDSNNDDVIDDSDDLVEDIADVDATPGKVILVNDGDVDVDGIPDYADGFDNIPGWADDDIIEGGQFVPLELTIPAALTNPTIEISYSASSPNKIQETVSNPYILPAGNLRLWKQDGSVARNANDVADGGDFVSPGKYSKTDFRFSGDTTTLYVEAIRESTRVADLIVSILVRDEDSGVVIEDQVRLTATRFEIEGVNLEGNWEVVTHFVASTLTSGDAEGLNRAWQSYRVNIYDPRQSGITSIDIEGQSLPLSDVGGKYQTAEFYTLTEDSVLPTSAFYVVVSGPDIDWDYNPGGKAKFIDLIDFNQWDAEITQEIIDVINQMEAENWKPAPPLPGKKVDPGAFGKRVHFLVSERLQLQGNPEWLMDIYVESNTRRIVSGPGSGITQIDILRIKPGSSSQFQVGKIINPTQIENIYELKTSISGYIDQGQRRRLKLILNGGNSNGPRKLKTAVVHKIYSPTNGGRFVFNKRYRNGLRLLTMLGVAANSFQPAHGMWTFDTNAPDFDKLLGSINIAKRAPGNSIDKASLWIQTDFREFLTGRFGDGAVVEIAIQGLNADVIWKKMQEIEN